ncbi:MAG TPA: bifunctional 23S rRNA (guanine(2069)-N(7))-methyltransferase RlmK/23S rRNA (guanine(2445)-N(2))-methyltransferase RlmL [Steroidobacteraceae bacterium]|nr:bifunctional 23S rRNA (guanine(2069)-N(7))-methyltransferase RlmK/23S rRNA (guanine(2445)-N(2))-methyltransferase RlmL [Steroidobacteraceae bacterium]
MTDPRTVPAETAREAQETFTFFVTCPRNVSDLLATELREFGIEVDREHPAGVSFRGPLRSAYLACLRARTASRVLLTLGEIDGSDPDRMHAGLMELPWESHVRADGTFAVDVVGEPPRWLRHTQFAALRAKDAIVDRFREQTGTRPSVDLGAPDLRVNLRFARERVTVGLDLSGEPLHRRGYRQSGVEAPLKENLAAALLLRAGWPAIAAEGGWFYDPMCGSGTLVIEAALLAARIAPGSLRRRFGFERWPRHDAALWQRLRVAAEDERDLAALEDGRCAGSDRDQNAIRACLANANRAGLGNHLRFERRDLSNLGATTHPRGLVLVNPPYGVRIGDAEQIETLYATLGDKLLRCFPGWEGAVFTGEPALGRALRLRAYRTHAFFNGPIEGRLLRFRLDESAREPDPEHTRAARLDAARTRPGAVMFGNRLRKNVDRLEKWARRTGVDCYRVYDADMPEYAFAVDVYQSDERWVYVQEYAAPDTVAREAARARRDEALATIPGVLGVPADRMVLRVRKRQKGGEQYEKLDAEGRFHVVREGRHRFYVNFTDYLDTGLFLDHRLTRARVGEMAAGKRFLNLFAYTGTATVHAAGGGAVASTTVDMSRTYLDWAVRNMELNGLRDPRHEFVQADCLAWLETQSKLSHPPQYDLVFVDPPTHSRSKRMEREFDVQRDHGWLLATTSRLLAPGGTILFSNNFQKFRLDPALDASFDVADITRATIPEDFARNARIHVCFMLRPRAPALAGA